MLSMKPNRVKRYAQIARLIAKYGRVDLVKDSSLGEHLSEDELATRSSKPEEFAKDLEALGPTFVKFGQLISTRADFLPVQFRDALARLQDDAQAIEYAKVEEIIETELGVKLHSVFVEFDERPFASASIGQVHLARLRGDRRVAVKVQRPGVRAAIMEDVAALNDIAQFLAAGFESLLRYQLPSLVARVKKSILRELDYVREASNAVALAENLKEFPRIVIPKPIEALSTEKVLTMEYISHTKITDIHPSVLLEIDSSGLADELFRAYLQQVVLDGLFHADPHPGNIALTHDHRLVLMDFGMVERVSKQLKPMLLKFLLAVSEGSSLEVARIAEESGRKGERFDRVKLRERIDSLVTENSGADISQLSVGRIMQDIQLAAGESDLYLPDAVVLLGKALMNLDLVVEKLDPSFNPNAVIRREGARLLERHSKEQFTLANAYQTLLDSAELAQELPNRVNRFTKSLADEGISITVQGFEEQQFLVALQKVANRITAGIIIASLIVGASLCMRVESSLTVLGYPLIAAVFFILAAFAGGVLLWQMLFRDK